MGVAQPVLYPVCPHRNVPAAFERFYGPDSGGIGRFFVDERAHDPFAALARGCESFEQRAAMLGAALHALLLLICAAVRVYGARALSGGPAHPQLALLPAPRPVPLLRAWLIAAEALPRAGRSAAACRVRLAHGWRHWAAHPQLSLPLGPQPVPALPV